MLFLQPAIAFGAIVLFIAVLWRIHHGDRPFEAAGFSISAAIAVFFICSGALIQNILQVSVFTSLSGQYPHGIIYDIYYQRSQLYFWLYGGFLTSTNLLSGVVVALLLLAIRKRNSIASAAIGTTLILIGNDISISTINAISGGYFSFHSAYRGTETDILFDIFGGIFIGSISFFAFNRANNISRRHGVKIALRELSFTIGKLFLVSVAAVLLLFSIFILPKSETLSASLDSPNDLDIRYASSTFWSITPAQVRISSVPAVELDLPKTSTAAFSVVQINGCVSDKQAVQVARDSSGLSYRLNGNSLDVAFPTLSTGRLLPLKKDATAEVIASAGAQSFGQTLDQTSFDVGFFGPGKLMLSPGSWAIAMDEGPLDGPVAIEAREGNKNYRLTPVTDKFASPVCHAVPMKDGSASIPSRAEVPTLSFGKHSRSFVVFLIEHATGGAYFPFSSQVSVHFPVKSDNGIYASLQWPSGLARELGTTSKKGTVSVGTRTYKHISSMFVAAPLLQVARSSSGRLLINGTSNYVVLNDDIVTRAPFWHLPAVLQDAILTGGFGLLLWLWPDLREKLVKFFKGSIES